MADDTQNANDFNKVFTFNNLLTAGYKCTLGVGWKGSTQYFKSHLVTEVAKLHREIINGTWKTKGFYNFTINERGKTRKIQAVHISERTLQKCLCDYSLTPLISKKLIYDNAACQKGKGINFAINRAKIHMRKFYRKYGAEGYVLRVDVSDYFASISHKILKEKLRPLYTDDRLYNLLCTLIDNCGGTHGLGLGSQISQSCAVYYLNDIDHKYCSYGYYARYMDDIYIINKDREVLKAALEELTKDLKEYDIEINPKKTAITTLKSGMKFLKKRFRLTETGKVTVVPLRKTFIRERRKIKKLVKHHTSKTTIEVNYTAWKSHLNICDAHKTLRRFERNLTGGQP